MVMPFVMLCVLAQSGAAPSIASVVEWRERLAAAKALGTEEERRDALVALAREALKGLDVQPAGTRHPDAAHPDDYKPAPVVNFDPHLQRKSSYAAAPGAPTRSLESNFGYYFAVRGTAYVVIGPAALDPRGPVFTRLAAGHELFHARHHVGDPRPIEERELEAWTAMFLAHFHDVHPFKQRWGPLVMYYDASSPVEQKITLDRLVAYYRNPPASAETASDAAAVRTAFDEWFERRRKDPQTAASKFVADLGAALAAPGR